MSLQFKLMYLKYLTLLNSNFTTMSIEIKTADVVRLILQFLKENNLNRAFEVLQQESKICINAVDKNALSLAILNGRWDTVLREVKNMHLPDEKWLSLYNLIIQDMLDHDERQAAKFAFEHFVKPVVKAEELQEKVLYLEELCNNGTKNMLFADTSKQKMKEKVAAEVCAEAQEPEPERLLKLLSHALKYQNLPGSNMQINLFQPKKADMLDEPDYIVKNLQKGKLYPSEVEVMTFNINGEYLAVGTFDGIIEIYDPETYELMPFDFQNTNNFMNHLSSSLQANNKITALSFNDTSEMLSSGDSSGVVKVWNLKNGKKLKEFQISKKKPVTTISFGIQHNHVLACSDTVQLYGLIGSAKLKEYKGHKDHINSLIVMPKTNQLLTCSKDGSIKLWNYNTQEVVKSYQPPSGLVVKEIKKLKVFSGNRLLVCMKSNNFIISQTDLSRFDTINLDSKQDTIDNLTCSGKGSYVYSGITTKKQHKIYVHNSKTRKVEYTTDIDEEVQLIEHHPSKNILVIFSKNQGKDGKLSFWTP